MNEQTGRGPETLSLPPRPAPEDLGYVYVTDAAGLEECVAALRGTRSLGVDIEGDSFFSYEESCCLVQLTGDDGPDWVVDPLSVKDLSSLGPLLADPQVTKIFHGADYDVVSLKRDFGFEIRGIFDTMIAAQATGHDRFGLGDLVHEYFGVTLNKRFQRHDWSSRPLEPRHLDYARKDTHFLPELRALLWDAALERGRGPMLLEEFELLESREWTGRPFDPDDCMRIKGAGKLKPASRRVLRAVFIARDARARERNRPAFKVWGNDVCLKVASATPADEAALVELLGDGHYAVRRYGEDLIGAVREGLADTGPPPVAKSRVSERSSDLPPFTRDDEPLLLQLKNWRNRRAKVESLAPGMIVNNSIMRAVAALKPETLEELDRIEDLRRWQRDAFGSDLLEVTSAWLLEEAAKAPPEEEAGKKRRSRRRRRRRKKGAEGGETEGS